MLLKIFSILLSVIIVVNSRPQSTPNINNILNTPEFSVLLEALAQKLVEQQQQVSSTTPSTTTTTHHRFDIHKNPFLNESPFDTFHHQVPIRRGTTTKRPQHIHKNIFEKTEEIGLQTSAPFIDLQKNVFLTKEITTATPPHNFFTKNEESSTRSPTTDLIKNVFVKKEVNPIRKLDKTESELEEKIFKQQAANAKYAFASEIDDTINDNSNYREEVRDGLAVKGKYSYSDGFYKRTVLYEADDKGYRVVGEMVEAIGEGPESNPNGVANVATYVAGSTLKYQISSDDIVKTSKTTIL